MRLLTAARDWIKAQIRRAASAYRRRFGVMRAEDVQTGEDLMLFWAKRRARGLGPTPTSSSAEGNAALHRTLNLNTQDAFRDLNMSNYRANSPNLKASRGIREIDGKYRRGVAFIVGAGPCLDKNIEELKRVRGRWPIFACDAALPMLAKHGIEPDYAMVVDTKPLQKRFFELVKPGTKTTLLAVSCSSPDVIAAWPGEVLYFNSWGEDSDEKVQLQHGQDFGSIGVGGNVSTALLCLVSIFCEATTIVLVGHDFSFRPDRYYATGGLQDIGSTKHGKPWWDIYGETVYTNLQLWAYKNFTVDFVGHLRELDRQLEAVGIAPMGYRIINATEGGILGTTEQFGVNSGLFEYAKLSDTISQLEAASVGSGVGAPTPRSETGDALIRQALARA